MSISEVYNFEYENPKYPGWEKVKGVIARAETDSVKLVGAMPGLISYRIGFPTEAAKKAFDQALLDVDRCDTNGEWCDEDCPFLKPHQGNLKADCTFLNVELSWHDFWLAQCLPDPRE